VRVFTTVAQLNPGQLWPDAEGGFPSPPFRHLLIENRGQLGSGNDLVCALGSRASNDIASTGFDFRVPAGCFLTRSAAGRVPGVEEGHSPLCEELSLLNIGQEQVAVYIELDDCDEIGQRIRELSPAGALEQAFSASTAAGAALTVSVPASQGRLCAISGFDCTLGIPAAAATVLLSVSGLPNVLDYALTASLAAGGGALVRFPKPIPASALAQAITVSLPAVGGGAAVNALTVYGFVQ
jgi:hypothetical protein